MKFWYRRKATPPEFTGNCMVRQYTADGHNMGPCWHSTYGGECHVHGDVAVYLRYAAGEVGEPWPADYQLAKYDGEAWAERLRARQANHKRGNGV